ncbi:MAG TPA: hypothetical protein VEL07_13815 [Planctomycetota bacterium]|nr:hypothetical protein [Planctomycetota bacterium]
MIVTQRFLRQNGIKVQTIADWMPGLKHVAGAPVRGEPADSKTLADINLPFPLEE